MDRYWLIGYGNYNNTHNSNFKGADIIIEPDGSIYMDSMSRPINFMRGNASICDSRGNLLFSCNGIYIADKNNNLIPDAILEGADISEADYGSNYAQTLLFLPIPNDTNRYYLLYNGVDSYGLNLYYCLLDKTLNNGNGGYISMNTPLIEDVLSIQGITAARHANGRDWWVVMPTEYSDEFYKILLTPDGLQTPILQKLNNIPHDFVAGGICSFGRKGDLYVRAGKANYNYRLYVMKFDRCTGLFYDERSGLFSTQSSLYFDGLAISPNQKYAYVCVYPMALNPNQFVYQYNVSDSDMVASAKLIATHNGAGSIFGGFNDAYLAPNDKIYIVDNTNTMSVINEPNLEGVACNLQQHSLQLPVINGRTVPNYPNFYLGALAGSGCDTLVSYQSSVNSEEVKVYPNPTNEYLSIEIADFQKEVNFCIENILGQKIYEQTISTPKVNIDLSHVESGVYFYKMYNTSSYISGKFVKH